MNLIYENDIPDMPENEFEQEEYLLVDDCGELIAELPTNNTLKLNTDSTIITGEIRDPIPVTAVQRYGLYNRWKPNGITDNRKEWKEKMEKRREEALTELARISQELNLDY